MINPKYRWFLVLLAALALSACGATLDEESADQWQTQLGSTERFYTDFSDRIDATDPNVVTWDPALAPADMRKHLELTLRFLVAFGIKNGAVSYEDGTALLAEHGITHKIPKPD